MKTTTENNVEVGHKDIAQLAKQIWEREGRQAGRDLEYWLRAERQLLSGRNRTGNHHRPAEGTVTDSVPEAGSTAKAPASARRIVHI